MFVRFLSDYYPNPSRLYLKGQLVDMSAQESTALIAAGVCIAAFAPVLSPVIVGFAGGQAVRTRDGTTDTSYAELAQFILTKEMGALMGARGFLDVEAVWTFSNVAQTKDLNVLVGGLSIGTPSAAANALSTVTKFRLYAEGALTDQVFLNAGLMVYATSTNALVERALNFGADQVISFQAKWSADPGAAATIRLLTYVATVYPSPV